MTDAETCARAILEIRKKALDAVMLDPTNQAASCAYAITSQAVFAAARVIRAVEEAAAKEA
jgi:hypothetical protein